ncbi:hypothetical protein [Ramlibacter albus]|uniref:Uncharacterized protein n=1 Tax=Ramlibacter albus TaxID=2079448 RepID=A0A923S402_9BURK|nr:hypothetical protein [Ramlibacter albus]MBC5766985.1 hypothetical protein [Ramlibacter albus]
MTPDDPEALGRADARVAEARRRVAAQEALIARGVLRGAELQAAYSLLHSMQRTLEVIEGHRDAMERVMREMGAQRRGAGEK